MKNLVIVSGITVSFLIVVLLFKLNKTKIEYDNKLLVLNRKVRDLTNLVDLSNTKNRLMNGEEAPGQDTQEQTNVNIDITDKKDSNNPIDTQYQNFVQNNGNFFDNLDNFEAPIPQEVKNDIDNLVNIENLDEAELMAQMEALDVETTTLPNSEVSLGEEANNTVTADLDATSVELPEAVLDITDKDLELVANEEKMDGERDDNNESTINQVVNVSDEQTTIEAEAEVEVDLEEIREVSLETVSLPDDSNISINVELETEVSPVSESSPVQVEEPEPATQKTVNFADLEDMSVKSLQELCREYKLKIKGRKDELIERIKEYLSVDKL